MSAVPLDTTHLLCSTCKVVPAHPCYGSRCEDCWALGMETVFSHRSLTLAIMVGLNHRRYMQETDGYSGSYRHWQGRVMRKGV